MGLAVPEEEQAIQGMDELLKEGWREFRQGQIVEGMVMKVGEEGALVNIGDKSEGIVFPREMRSFTSQDGEKVQVGERVQVYILAPMGEEGGAVLSLDRARMERGWRLLEECQEAGKPLKAQVVSHNRGGAIVDVEGVQGFVPLSQLSPGSRGLRGEGDGFPSLQHLVGRELHLKVVEVDRRRSRVILSERAGLQERREEQKGRLLQELHEGEVRRGRVSGICNFGVFVDIGGADGLIHISELSWRPFNTPEEIVRVGDEVEVYVLKVDQGSKKIALSLRRLEREPWDTFSSQVSEGQLVQGRVTRLTNFGAFARVEESLEGLIHISELSHKNIRHPMEVVKEGDLVTLKVIRIEPERRRLSLSLKQAIEEGAVS